MKRTLLHDNWRFRFLQEGADFPQAQVRRIGWMPAAVPGFVHLDLVRNRVVADPFLNLHELGCQWVDETDWVYETEFYWQPGSGLPQRVLRFEGLDTFCTISLNGELLGESENMFLPVEFDVKDRLEPGLNRLTLTLRSAGRVGTERRREYFAAEGLDWKTDLFDDRAFVRKAQYMFGWDWGPRLVSCGIFGSVELLEFQARITEFSPLIEPLENGRFRLISRLENGGEPFELSLDGDPIAEVHEFEPELWWPNGEGAQRLYSLRASVEGHDVEKKVGFKTVRLLRGTDEFGRNFEFEVNGRRIWARGANWIPNDSFVTRVHGLDNQISRYAGLNMNMLRVWGGGFYESEEFYDACDRHGLLIWQDFPYACSFYPDSAEYLAEARREAMHHVKRLRSRASLALWCGNNENEALWVQRWAGEASPPRYYGEAIYSQVVPDVVGRESPDIPYVSSSPISVREGEELQGDAHYWNVWHGAGDWKHYDESRTRFSSEFGFASSCSLACWQAASDVGLVSPTDPVATWHDKTNKGWEKFSGYVELHYPPATNLEEWVYYSQLNQRDAMRHGIEHYRRSEECRGTLVWQANDCWPVQSWSLEDYTRRLKPAGHELQRLYAPVILSVVRAGDGFAIWLINDGPKDVSENLVIRQYRTTDGGLLQEESFSIFAAADSRRQVFSCPIADESILFAQLEGVPHSRTWRLSAEPKEVSLQAAPLKVTTVENGLLVAPATLVIDLVLWDETDPLLTYEWRPTGDGWDPYTGAIPFTILGGRPGSQLRARSLAGEHQVNIL